VQGGHKNKIERGCIDDLAGRRAFYAEFASLPQHLHFVEQLYVMKDCGIMTADRRTFASPFTEIAFLFASAPDGLERASRVVVKQPSFGHRNKKRPFHGWVFGIKCRGSPTTNLPCVVRCQDRLRAELSSATPLTSVVEALDQLCSELALRTVSRVKAASFRGERTVAELAARQRLSARTLHRHATAATGLPPKRLLAVERFRRAVSNIPNLGVKLSEIADGLGFADQAHMTREFRRHAGLSPGVFRRIWGVDRGETVRFIQDGDSSSRLRLIEMGGLGPMLGQAQHFHRYATEKVPYAIDRYTKEGRRLLRVMEQRLNGHDYLVGDYSIADIACFPWVRIHKMANQSLVDLPRVSHWYSIIRKRPAVERGLKVLLDKWVDVTKSEEARTNLFGDPQYPVGAEREAPSS
jgi:AraC-like DNA-binding protein